MKHNYSVRDLVLIAFFAALTAILAYVTIPMPGGLPFITGQSFAVMLAGLLLGARNGAMSQVIYLMLGLAGLPVFAGGTGGVGILAGYSGGFIWGFVLGAYVIGKLTQGRQQLSLARLLGATIMGGVLAVYVPGILQMSQVLHITPLKALLAMLPYVPGDLLKVVISSTLARKIVRHMQ